VLYQHGYHLQNNHHHHSLLLENDEIAVAGRVRPEVNECFLIPSASDIICDAIQKSHQETHDLFAGTASYKANSELLSFQMSSLNSMTDFNRQVRNHWRTHQALSSVGGRRRLFIHDHHSDHINDHHDQVQLGNSHHINDDDRNLANFYPNEEAKCGEMNTESHLRPDMHMHGL
jgi:hypothetical protein